MRLNTIKTLLLSLANNVRLFCLPRLHKPATYLHHLLVYKILYLVTYLLRYVSSKKKMKRSVLPLLGFST